MKTIGDEKISSQTKSDCVRKLISSPKLLEMNRWRNIFLIKCKCLGEKSYFVTQCIYFVWEKMSCHPIYLKSTCDKKKFITKWKWFHEESRFVTQFNNFLWKNLFHHPNYLKWISDEIFSSQKVSFLVWKVILSPNKFILRDETCFVTKFI